MKKLLTLFISLLMIMSLVGCASSSDVTLTLPAYFYSNTKEVTQEELDPMVKDGIKSLTVSDDGTTVTAVMSKDRQNTTLKSVKDQLDTMIKSLAEDGSHVSDVKYNDGLSEFDVYITDEEIGIYDAIAAISFTSYGLIYNTYTGKESSKVTINYHKTDGSIIDSSSYEGTFSQFMDEFHQW
ncbi:MAG: hypothetical protein Q4D13_05580 [Erysipelotrichaceae bacterium]|nr:hypothetical protein [Erysipelotrichaceae bacterium]